MSGSGIPAASGEHFFALRLCQLPRKVLRRFDLLLSSGFGTQLVRHVTMDSLLGVLSYAVAQRTREIGIRMALGAQARAVLGLVVRRALLLAAAGVGIGVILALGLSRSLVSKMLFSTSPHDAATFVSVGRAPRDGGARRELHPCAARDAHGSIVVLRSE